MDKTTTKMWRQKLEVIEERARRIKDDSALLSRSVPSSFIELSDGIHDLADDIEREIEGLGNQIERSVDELIDRLGRFRTLAGPCIGSAAPANGPTLTVRVVVEGPMVKETEVGDGQETETRD